MVMRKIDYRHTFTADDLRFDPPDLSAEAMFFAKEQQERLSASIEAKFFEASLRQSFFSEPITCAASVTAERKAFTTRSIESALDAINKMIPACDVTIRVEAGFVLMAHLLARIRSGNGS